MSSQKKWSLTRPHTLDGSTVPLGRWKEEPQPLMLLPFITVPFTAGAVQQGSLDVKPEMGVAEGRGEGDEERDE